MSPSHAFIPPAVPAPDSLSTQADMFIRCEWTPRLGMPPTPGAGIGLADSSNEAEQTQETSVLNGNTRPALSVNSRVNIYRNRRHARSRIRPTRPLIRRPPQRNRTARARSRLQGHARVHVVETSRRRPLSWRGHGLIRNQHWADRLCRIVKPSRPSKKYRTPRRTRYVSLGSWPEKNDWVTSKPMTDSLEKANWNWISNFQTLRISKAMKTWTNPDTDQVLQYYWKLLSDRSFANEGELKLQDRAADRIWLNVMLWCLRYQKKKALLLLLVTMKGRIYRPPRYAVADSLRFLSRHFLFEVAKPDPKAFDTIWFLTRKFIEGAGGQEVVFSVPQHLVFNVLRHMDDSRFLSFFWLLGENKAVLHVHTMFHFLDRFVEMGRVDTSMRLLSTIAKTKYDLSRSGVQMACVKLLRTRFDTPEEYTIRSNMLAQMLEMGVKPKIEMFNAILVNAGEGGDFANAWKMYSLARENGFVPDSITYNVLLKGALLSGSLSNINLVVREIQANPEVLQNLGVLIVMLRAISLTVSPEDEFGAMLDLYKQHCDLRPLQDLSLVGIETQVSSNTSNHGLQPTELILRQMILAYIRRCLRQSRGPFDLIHNYNLYYRHVKENHPLITPLARHSAITTAFIMAFGRRTETLQHCITVVRHMLELSSQRHAASDTVAYSGPTVHTWSALLGAYIFNRQSRAAEKVLDMMRKRGIEYNDVTWNTLISGYAGMQDVDKAAKAVKEMEAAGFEADAYTAKGLGRLWLQDKLIKALRPDLEEAPSNETTIEGHLPPLSPDDEHEARQALEWEPMSLDRRSDKREYLDGKYEGMESDNQSEDLLAAA